MLKLQAVRGRFGKLYIIRTLHDSNIPQGLNAEQFTDPHSAKRFLIDLSVGPNYWNQLSENTAEPCTTQKNSSATIGKACQLLISGKLKVFDVTSLYSNKTVQKSENSVFKKADNSERYRFEPSLSLLTNQSANTKQFHTQGEAEAFIKELAPDQAQLTQIINHVNAPNSPPPIGNLDNLIAALSQDLVGGSAIISVEKSNTSSSPKEELLDTTNLPGSKKADLGPPQDYTPAPEQKLISVSWSVAEAMCGDDVVLNGSAVNFPANTTASADIIFKAYNNATLTTQTQGQDTFTQPWKVRDAVFSGDAMPDTFELDAKLSALGQTVKTPSPLIIKRVPDAPEELASFRLTSGRFGWNAAFRIAIEKNILHVKQTLHVKQAWLGHYIKFDPLLDNRDDLVFVKKENTTWKFWDNTTTPRQWIDLPRDVSDYTLNPLYLIKRGTNFVSHNNLNVVWPGVFAEPLHYDFKKQAWLDCINDTWNNKFILKHKGCVSSSAQCCAWDLRFNIDFSDTSGEHLVYFVSSPDYERSNTELWFLSDPRPWVAAHECGHLLGAYDEYTDGALDPNTNLIANSLMGSNSTTPYPRHLNEMKARLTNKINSLTGKSWEFEIKAK